jgi:membrane protein YdbS with pleckstrin-like domain
VTVSEAIDRLSEQEYERWFQRRLRRRERMWKTALIALVLFWIVSVIAVSFLVVDACCGENEWPSMAFLAVLMLWASWTLWRYLEQPRERDEDEDRLEYYIHE